MATIVESAIEPRRDPAPFVKPPRHVAGLDGLRALAILAVMGVHAGAPGFELGWVGVDLFFVLSGFLITSLLAEEFARNGRISLAKFWGRRFLRLMPAYWAYAGGLTIALLFFRWGWTHAHGGWSVSSYLASMWLYFINYLPKGGIWEHQWLSIHLWSLAVEEQFYFAWPILCAAALWLGRPAWTAWALVVVVMGRWIWIDTGETHLDRRGLGILLGCAVALSLRQGGWPRLRVRLDSASFRIAILIAIAAVIVIGTYLGGRGYSEEDVRRVALPVLAPLFALLVAMIWYGPNDRITRALSWRPLVYIGTISYGMYLYHMLAHQLTWDVLTAGMAGWPRWPKFALRFLIYLAATLGIATLSYRLLEEPFLRLKGRLR